MKLEHRGQEGAPEVELHAWLTRNDRDGADGQPPRRSEGFDQSCDEGLISPHGTLAGLACSEGVIAVGGYHWQPPTAAQAEASFLDPDSSLGLAPHGGLPARPEVHAPSAMVFHGDVRGVGSVGYLGDAPPPDDRLGRGTSMAAPWVARQCANRLAVRGPLRRQHLLKELQAAPATLPLLLKDAPQDKRP